MKLSVSEKQDSIYLPLPKKAISPINNISSLEKIKLGKLFKEAFKEEKITSVLLSNVNAAFERSLITPNFRFDQFMRRKKEASLI